jgi:hypothetical protein
MSDPTWQNGKPAFATVLVKLLELHARMLRLEAARRHQRTLETTKLLRG